MRQRLYRLKFFSNRGYIAKKFYVTEAMLRKNFKVEYLNEFKTILKNILGGYSGAPGGLNHEKKTGGQKSCDTVPLRMIIKGEENVCYFENVAVFLF